MSRRATDLAAIFLNDCRQIRQRRHRVDAQISQEPCGLSSMVQLSCSHDLPQCSQNERRVGLHLNQFVGGEQLNIDVGI
jgi:hypothetical protein